MGRPGFKSCQSGSRAVDLNGVLGKNVNMTITRKTALELATNIFGGKISSSCSMKKKEKQEKKR